MILKQHYLNCLAHASILQREGFALVAESAGGVAAWQAAKMPVEPSA